MIRIGNVAIQEKEMRIAATSSQVNVSKPFFMKIKEQPQMMDKKIKMSQLVVE